MNGTVSGGGGNDKLYGDVGADKLYGNNGNDSLTGGDGNDSLLGGSGDDTIRGGAGNDVMRGGAGNDVIYFTNGDLFKSEVGKTYDIGGAGRDVLIAEAGARFNTQNLGAYGFEGFRGAELNDDVAGVGTTNFNLDGGGGNDRLIGGSGNDSLNGGAGADTLNGGAGDDSYYVDNVGDTIAESSNGGNDRIAAAISIDLLGRDGAYTNVENVTLIGSATIAHGTGTDNSLIGNEHDNLLNGRDGNDSLNGGLGADRMTGGAGNDVYYVDDGGDVTEETENAGTDLIYASISIDLKGRDGAFENTENLALLGSENINGYGSDDSNRLIGNSGANILSGREGNDIFDGGAGNDGLTGGSGIDTFIFKKNGDKDIILDFENNIDTIKILNFANVTNFTQATAHAQQVGSDAVFDLGSDDILTVKGVKIADLADDMVFV